MNTTTYPTYAPAINAYLNPQDDSPRKSWNDVVTVFFAMSVDKAFSSNADLAETFNNASEPNNVRINATKVQKYIPRIELSSSILSQSFKKGIDFIEDDEGLRFTFEIFRIMLYRGANKDVTFAFGSIDKMYQAYVKYTLEMKSSLTPTHWMLVERISDFTQVMQPHKQFKDTKGEKFFQMDEQPQAFSIFTGTLQKLTARADKYKTEHETGKNPKYAAQPLGEIYESVMSNIDDEIDAVIRYIEENTAKPYRVKQVEDGKARLLSKTKHLVKLSKTCILISQKSEQLYTAERLLDDVAKVRDMIKLGQTTHTKKPSQADYEKPRKVGTKELANNTDIKIFYKSKGEYFDSLKRIKMKLRDCDKPLQPLDDDMVGKQLNFDNAEDSEEEAEEEVANEISKRCRTVPVTPPPNVKQAPSMNVNKCKVKQNCKPVEFLKGEKL